MSINLKREYGNESAKKSVGATMEEMLEENLKLTREMHEMVQNIKNYVFWARVWGFLKIIIIVIPLAIGFLYLPALLGNAIAPYKSLLENSQDGQNLLNSLKPSTISGDLKGLIK